MPQISTMTKASGSDVDAENWVRARKTSRAMNAESMKTSPWAKLIMPMMP